MSTTLTLEKIELFKIDKYELEELVKNKLGIDYKFEHIYNEIYEINDCAIDATVEKNIAKLQSGQHETYMEQEILDYLCAKEYIPAGNYLIVG